VTGGGLLLGIARRPADLWFHSGPREFRGDCCGIDGTAGGRAADDCRTGDTKGRLLRELVAGIVARLLIGPEATTEGATTEEGKGGEGTPGVVTIPEGTPGVDAVGIVDVATGEGTPDNVGKPLAELTLTNLPPGEDVHATCDIILLGVGDNAFLLLRGEDKTCVTFTGLSPRVDRWLRVADKTSRSLGTVVPT